MAASIVLSVVVGLVWALGAGVPTGAKEVTFLPGLRDKIGFRHFSGHLKASPNRFLHYWLTESQKDPANDPLLVWMNGGPGCSSLDGLLSELGPFHVNDDGQSLYINPYSWNLEANVLFLEAPACVGFSYSLDKNCTTDDDQTSMDNYNALKDFFAQFPELVKNPLFITGESYAGIYVPTLAARIVDGMSQFKMNLKGVAIGNGLVSSDLNVDTLMQFTFSHGMIDQNTWDVLETSCCKGCADTCPFHDATSAFCEETVNKVVQDTWSLGLNVYDLYRDCFHPQRGTIFHRRFHHDLASAFPKFAHMFRRLDKMHHQQWNLSAQADADAGGMDPPCLDSRAVTTYLNRLDVRKSLFIPSFVAPWSVCSDAVNQNYQTLYKDMFEQARKLINFGARILIYNGDTDLACNFLMGQKFAQMLKQPMVSNKRAWKVDEQIGGFVTQYQNVDFVTIKGAGHMVPQWRPKESLKMIQSFLKQEPY